MGAVHANIELVNHLDLEMAAQGQLAPEKIRRVRVNALVDTGSVMLCINQEVFTQLGLRVTNRRAAQLADGQIVEVDYSSPMTVFFENRESVTRAIVLPGSTEVLLGQIPLEEMDVLIDPGSNRLIVNPAHPHAAQLYIK